MMTVLTGDGLLALYPRITFHHEIAFNVNRPTKDVAKPWSSPFYGADIGSAFDKRCIFAREYENILLLGLRWLKDAHCWWYPVKVKSRTNRTRTTDKLQAQQRHDRLACNSWRVATQRDEPANDVLQDVGHYSVIGEVCWHSGLAHAFHADTAYGAFAEEALNQIVSALRASRDEHLHVTW